MNSKAIKIIYWTATIFFSLAMFADGVVGVLRVTGGKEALAYLSYPEYDLTIFGIAKILGVIAILQTKFLTVKEWAYAGFTFILIGGMASHAFVGSHPAMLIPAIVMLGIMFISYFLWKRIESGKMETI